MTLQDIVNVIRSLLQLEFVLVLLVWASVRSAVSTILSILPLKAIEMYAQDCAKSVADNVKSDVSRVILAFKPCSILVNDVVQKSVDTASSLDPYGHYSSGNLIDYCKNGLPGPQYAQLCPNCDVSVASLFRELISAPLPWADFANRFTGPYKFININSNRLFALFIPHFSTLSDKNAEVNDIVITVVLFGLSCVFILAAIDLLLCCYRAITVNAETVDVDSVDDTDEDEDDNETESGDADDDDDNDEEGEENNDYDDGSSSITLDHEESQEYMAPFRDNDKTDRNNDSEQVREPERDLYEPKHPSTNPLEPEPFDEASHELGG